jgi:site-specific recombinase XerD
MTAPGNNLISHPLQELVPVSYPNASRAVLPAPISDAGPAAAFAWEEFFQAQLRNPHTRALYRRAVLRFLAWLEPQGVSLVRVTPGMVGSFFDRHPGGVTTRKAELAALRRFFDVLVQRHVLLLNPAASVRGERYQAVEGLTPEITPEQARALLASLPTGQLAGLRDRAVLATMIYTAARAGAVAALKRKHLGHDGTQYTLRFAEKGGKSREIPVRHDLQGFLLDYLRAAGLEDAPGDSPLFRTCLGRTDRLSGEGMTGVDVCRMMKRRLRDAGLPLRLSPHSIRVATITDLLLQGVPLEDVQFLAGHSDPRTTRLYDRRHKQVTRKIVDRISI